jgi:hypothetical protein
MAREYVAAINFESDDTQYITEDVFELAKQFIGPINNFRSFAKPQFVISANANDEDGFANLQTSNGYKESPLSALYRMIGFPVTAGDDYYNPGFNSAGASKDKIKKIDSEVNGSNKIKNAFNQRETGPEELLNIFAGRNLTSSLYALTLVHPRPFLVLDPNKGPFEFDSTQSGNVEDRKKLIDNFTTLNPGLSDSIASSKSALSSSIPGSNIDGWRHILKPFISDPKMSNVVQPDTRMICAPFLQNIDVATKVGPTDKDNLYRPWIEYVIRKRLANIIIDPTFLKNVQDIQNNTITPERSRTIDVGDLADVAIALSKDNNISASDLNKIFNKTTTVQLIKISEFTKLIKVAVKVLHQSIKTINKAKQHTNWVPLCGVDGPAILRGTILNEQGISSSNSNIDKKKVDLELKILLARTEADSTINTLKFVPPVDVNSGQKDLQFYQNELNQLLSKRDQIAKNAFIALRDIELITGEVSGLGLIDIFAIYAAIWSVDEETLVGLLDQESFNRMIVFNPELITKSVQLRINNGGAPLQNITTTLEKFQEKVISFLSFADWEFVKQTENPLARPSGTINS